MSIHRPPKASSSLLCNHLIVNVSRRRCLAPNTLDSVFTRTRLLLLSLSYFSSYFSVFQNSWMCLLTALYLSMCSSYISFFQLRPFAFGMSRSGLHVCVFLFAARIFQWDFCSHIFAYCTRSVCGNLSFVRESVLFINSCTSFRKYFGCFFYVGVDLLNECLFFNLLVSAFRFVWRWLGDSKRCTTVQHEPVDPQCEYSMTGGVLSREKFAQEFASVDSKQPWPGWAHDVWSKKKGMFEIRVPMKPGHSRKFRQMFSIQPWDRLGIEVNLGQISSWRDACERCSVQRQNLRV